MQPKPIRSFSRGLAVLSALNQHGCATALTLARESGVPRATVYRLLQTLLDEGYVGRRVADDQFRLMLKVRSLSQGFEDEQWISSIAGPAVAELTRQIALPCDVAALEGLRMVIHDTTHCSAPLSIDRNMIGQELPILVTATGLAYISFAPEEERKTLLALLARSRDPRDALARNPEQVARLIDATRRRGYALRQGLTWPHTGTLALPVRANRRVLGAINTIWMARVVSAAEGVKRYLEPLRATRDLIERKLSEARVG